LPPKRWNSAFEVIYQNKRGSVSTAFSNTEKRLKKRGVAEFFLVFGNLMKHSFKCLI